MMAIVCVSSNEYIVCLFKHASTVGFDSTVEQYWDSFDKLLESLSKNEGVFSEDNEYIENYIFNVDIFILNEAINGCFPDDDPVRVREVCELLNKHSLYEKYVARLISKAMGFEKIQLYLLEGLTVDTLNELMSDSYIKRAPHLVEYINKVIKKDLTRNLKDRDYIEDNGLSL